jgi:hypothetical protein
MYDSNPTARPTGNQIAHDAADALERHILALIEIHDREARQHQERAMRLEEIARQLEEEINGNDLASSGGENSPPDANDSIPQTKKGDGHGDEG